MAELLYELLEELSVKQAEAMSNLHALYKENEEWLNEIRNECWDYVYCAQPVISRTPMARRQRRRKRGRNSTDSTFSDVEILHPQRITRNALKIAREASVLVTKATEDSRPSKRMKKNKKLQLVEEVNISVCVPEEMGKKPLPLEMDTSNSFAWPTDVVDFSPQQENVLSPLGNSTLTEIMVGASNVCDSTYNVIQKHSETKQSLDAGRHSLVLLNGKQNRVKKCYVVDNSEMSIKKKVNESSEAADALEATTSGAEMMRPPSRTKAKAKSKRKSVTVVDHSVKFSEQLGKKDQEEEHALTSACAVQSLEKGIVSSDSLEKADIRVMEHDKSGPSSDTGRERCKTLSMCKGDPCLNMEVSIVLSPLKLKGNSTFICSNIVTSSPINKGESLSGLRESFKESGLPNSTFKTSSPRSSKSSMTNVCESLDVRNTTAKDASCMGSADQICDRTYDVRLGSGKIVTADKNECHSENNTEPHIDENKTAVVAAEEDCCVEVQSKEKGGEDVVNSSIEENVSPLRKQVGPQTPKTKKLASLFSPYANESVKKRVAAYEKLNAGDLPVVEQPVPRMTRTKARAIAAAAAMKESGASVLSGKQMHKEPRKNKDALKKLGKVSLSKTKKVVSKSAMMKRLCPESLKENSCALTSATGNTSSQKLLTPRVLRELSNVSSGIGSSVKPSAMNGLVLTANKSQQKLLLTTPRILGDLSNSANSTHSAQAPKSASGKPGIILTGTTTFITKAPTKQTAKETEERKMEERRRKDEKVQEAARKREEMLRKRAEMQRRKWEEKREKLKVIREAQEREKCENLRLYEEKNERAKQLMQEQEAKLKEETNKKKQHTQQKLAVVEERRKVEEAARLAKLKEQEEEQQRIQAARKKEQEDAEKLRLKRLAEEREAARLREMAEETAKTEVKAKGNHQAQETPKPKAGKEKVPASYSMTPLQDSPVPPKTADDYGIDDVDSNDDTDSEECPKKRIPAWAQKPVRFISLELQDYCTQALVNQFISCPKETPDFSRIFPTMDRKRLMRTSSAVWRTPPRFSELPS